MRSRWLLVPLAALMLSCGTGVKASDLEKHAEAHLRYPGSRIVQVVHEDESTTGDSFAGPSMVHAASSGAYMDSHASLEQITTWYEQWLVSHGWHRLNGIPASFQRGDREDFVVGEGGERIPGHDPTATPYYALYYVTPAACRPHQGDCET